ncbi:hypothetical protein ABPG74_005225 [Tetrahymena malaccensis]
MSRYSQNEESKDLNVSLLSYRDENINDLGYIEDNDQQEELKSVNNEEKLIQYSYNHQTQSNAPGQNSQQNQNLGSLQQKQQPFMTQFIQKQLQGSLLKDGYEMQKEVCSNLKYSLFKGYSKKIKKQVFLQVIKCTQEDFTDVKNTIEKIIGIDTLQFVQKYYNVLFYSDLFLAVVVQDPFKITLKQELQLNDGYDDYQKNIILFQISHALTEIHSYDIIHYSLSPSTIIKTEDGVYKLSFFDDFIKLKSRQLPDDFDIRYISPELSWFLNEENQKFDFLSNKVDVYSLGILIIEIVKSHKKSKSQSLQQQNNNQSEKVSGEQKKNDENNISNIVGQLSNDSSKKSIVEERFSLNKSICYSNVEESECGQVSSTVLKSQLKLEIQNEDELFYNGLLNPNPCLRFNSSEVFSKLLQFIQINQSYINSMLSSIYRSLKVDIFSRNKNESYLKQLRINYSELRLQLILRLPLNQQLTETKFYSYKNTALLYIQNSDYSKGLDYSLRCLEIVNSNDNEDSQQVNVKLNIKENVKEKINLQIVISLCYEKLKQFEQSLQHSKESYELSKQQNPEIIDYYLLGKSCCRLSWSYCRLKDGYNAVKFGQESLQAYSKLNKKKFILCMAEALDALGCAYELIQNYQESLQQYQKSLELRYSVLKQDHPAIAQSYYNIGLIQMFLQEDKKALQNFITSASLYKLHKQKYINQIKQSYSQVHTILINQNNQDLADEIMIQINQLTDNDNNNNNID